jgi:hypothetical protein
MEDGGTGTAFEAPMRIADWIEDPRQLMLVMFRIRQLIPALQTFALLGIPDLIDEDPVSVSELARRAGAHEDSLARVLRFLASEGLLCMTQDGLVAHNALSRMLRADHPQSVKPQFCVRDFYEAHLLMPEGVKTGEVPYKLRYGSGQFEYLAAHPEHAKPFAELMTATTRVAEEDIFGAHRFHPFKLAVDVGGSHGSLLRRLLAEHPAAQGILFDLPHVAADAEARWADEPDAARLKAIGGSFFDWVPAGADLYLLKQILHDWPDEDCLRILRNVRAAMAPDGRIAIVERLLPEELVPDAAWAMDLSMLALVGGRERNLAEFEALLGQAGLSLSRATGTASGLNVIEALPI